MISGVRRRVSDFISDVFRCKGAERGDGQEAGGLQDVSVECTSYADSPTKISRQPESNYGQFRIRFIKGRRKKKRLLPCDYNQSKRLRK